jgi:hypothetical protein
MGDISIANDLLSGVTDALADLGSTRTVRITTFGALTPGAPGAGGTPTDEDISVEALLYDFEDKYINNTSILKGDRKAILSIEPLSVAQVNAIKQGVKLIDGTDVYTVVKASPIEVAGTSVTIILHIRGA